MLLEKKKIAVFVAKRNYTRKGNLLGHSKNSNNLESKLTLHTKVWDGARVVILRNNKSDWLTRCGVANGALGTLIKVHHINTNGRWIADWGLVQLDEWDGVSYCKTIDRCVKVTFVQDKELTGIAFKLAYCSTFHKAQEKEFEILFVNINNASMYPRNPNEWYAREYTAISREKKLSSILLADFRTNHFDFFQAMSWPYQTNKEEERLIKLNQKTI